MANTPNVIVRRTAPAVATPADTQAEQALAPAAVADTPAEQPAEPAAVEAPSAPAPVYVDVAPVTVDSVVQQLLIDGDLGLDNLDPEIVQVVGTMAQTHGKWTKATLYSLAEYTVAADPKYAIHDKVAFINTQRRLWNTIRTILTTEGTHYALQLSAALGIIHAYREGAFSDNSIFRHCDEIPVPPAAAAEMRYLITMLVHLANPATRKAQTELLAKGISKYTESLGESSRNRLLNYLNLN